MISGFSKRGIRGALYFGVAAAALTAAAAPAFAQALPTPNFTRQWSSNRLANADNEPSNWLHPNQNLSSWRYSGLTQINRETVGDLRMAFAISLGHQNDTSGNNGPNIMATPLVDDGIMYAVSSWQRVFKLDVRNPGMASIVWISDPEIPHEGNASETRGIAFAGTNIINPLADNRLVAHDRDTGEIVWDEIYPVPNPNGYGGNESFNSAPLCWDGKCIVTNAAGDAGTRGWVAAADWTTGEELWRWYVVPEPGQPGSETWVLSGPNSNAWQRGGGGLWTTGSIDTVNNTAVWGTGNPVPTYDPEARPGDNLYTDSVIALDMDTGELQWYFQYLPNDSWDYDENGVHQIVTIPVNGEMTRVVTHFGRNGMYYNFTADNGTFINGGQWVNDLNWTAGLDPKTGKPIEYDPNLLVQQYIPATRTLRGDPAETACPTWHGGTAHQPPAYNPVKFIAYAAHTEGCFTQNGGTGVNPTTDRMTGRTFTSDLYYGAVTAVYVPEARVIAKVNQQYEIRSGMLATAGGLAFTALTEGALVAYNDETLEELWRFNVGTPLKAPPMTYAVNGRQYVAFQTSGHHVHPIRWTNLQHSEYLFVFTLEENLAL